VDSLDSTTAEDVIVVSLEVTVASLEVATVALEATDALDAGGVTVALETVACSSAGARVDESPLQPVTKNVKAKAPVKRQNFLDNKWAIGIKAPRL
jgi:hypothetical protein